MNIKDLEDTLPFSSFFNECRTKLGNTLVKYAGDWFYCIVQPEPKYYDDNEILKHYYAKKGKGWLSLSNTKDKRELNTTEHIETEPVWPEAGFYFCENTCIKLYYKKGKYYKAGLPPDLVNLEIDDGDKKPLSPQKVAYYLNTLDQNQYPPVGDCLSILLNTPNTRVPISKDVVVTAHPYCSVPVVMHTDVVIGMVTDNGLVLSQGNKMYQEILTHAGVPLA